MLLFDGGAGLLLLALWVFCVLDVITTDESTMRNLPKFAWLVIVLLLPDIGSVAWLVAGRPRGRRQPAGRPGRPERDVPAEYDRPGRARAASPDDDAAFLAQLRRRTEEQRRRAREQRRDNPPG